MIAIERAVLIPRKYPEARYQLPPGYPFLVDDDNGDILELPLLYTVARFPIDGVWKERTLAAAVFDISKIFHACDEAKISISDVDSDFLAQYRDKRLNDISAQTHNTRSGRAEARGFSRIYDIFSWGVSTGVFETNPFDDFLADEQDDAYTSDGWRIRRSKLAAFYKPIDGDQEVRAMTHVEWGAIRSRLLGPEAKGSVRDPLAAEIAVSAGPRVEEIARLEAWQIEELGVTDAMAEDHILRLQLLWTKGGRTRKVELAAALVRDLLVYIKGERARCIALSQRYKQSPDEADTLALFVNREDSGRYVGLRTSADTLAEGFRTAVKDCGLLYKVKKVDPETGQEYFTLLPKYSFHCLRHTFAVWYYIANSQSGHSAPWKDLQTLLGHRFLSTTLNIYLHAVDQTRDRVNAKVFAAVRRKYSGH